MATPILQGFNGATRLHAWKQARQLDTHFRGKVLQWSHASSRVETYAARIMLDNPGIGFNGATRLHAWKHGSRIARSEAIGIASMEPRVFTRGNVSLDCGRQRA